ncbi:hypothetical protein B5P44_01350 [Mycobacterium sp. CBMA 213]|nr:hypothetical protein [Mycolicibacterium sp. CBMA 213]
MPAERVEVFAALTEEIITSESGWNPDACALAVDSSSRGPAALFGGANARGMPDGRSYATPRGLAQLTPWIFEQHHAAGTSTDIYDPVASIAALWLFIADRFAVDLLTGAGVAEFSEKWVDHRADWWWLTELAPFNRSPQIPGY